MRLLGPRTAIVATLAAAAAWSSGASLAAGDPPLVVFGDSYSELRHHKVPNWPTQLKAGGAFGRVYDFAQSGATATPDNRYSFADQIRAWRRAGRPVGQTVVYFGNNDIGGNLTKSRSGYAAGVNALIGAGARSGDNRLYFVMPHNIGGTPFYDTKATRTDYRDSTRQWDSFVSSLAHQKGAKAVNLYTLFDRVVGNPRRYGFTNVTSPDPRRAATTALYADDFHFGAHGQRLIADAIGGYLRSGSRFAEELASDAPADGAGGSQGLAFFPVGDGPAVAADPSTMDADPTRAGFEEAYGRGDRQGGVGLTYGAGGTTLGFAVTSDDGGSPASAQLSGPAADSDGVSAFVRQRLGAFQLDTRFAYSRDRDAASAAFDGSGGGRDTFDGRALDLAQRVGVPVRGEGYTLTPWAELGYRSRQIDGLDVGAGQRSAEAEVGDALASFGLDGRAAPIRLGEATWLTLGGELSYTQGLGGGDYSVRLASSTETVDRSATQAVALSLTGSLAVGRDLAIDAGLSLEHDLDLGPAEAAHVGLSWHF